MNGTELGRRIREARLAKKLTQAEVVGDFITRNMLSQIESGTALPSVKTLQYLSKVLEVPMAQLMPEEEANADGAADYMQVREDFVAERFQKVAETPEIAGFTDELSAIRSKAYLELARQAKDGDLTSLQTAADYAKKAAQLSEKGMFANSSVRSEALLLLNSIASRLSDYYKNMATGEFEEAGL